MKNFTVTPVGGRLGRMYESATRYFLEKIDPLYHAGVYVGIHSGGFAETEFAGKYLDTCVQYANYMKEVGRNRDYELALSRAYLVAHSIMKNQRADGYIGGLGVGNELFCFSVWNQAFTLYGLLSYYELTGDKDALVCGEKIALYNAGLFMGGADITSGGNNGSQHLSFLMPLVRLCKFSKNPRIPEFAHHIVSAIRASDNNFLDFRSILDLRSKKGIENFVILIGLISYADFFAVPEILVSCKKYWQELADTQIRGNGNGTLREVWTVGGNRPRRLGLDVRPDENCVAVGWIEFSLVLYYHTGEAKYIDAVERALYNHLSGAVAPDGSDFAYYQPNYGRRISRTAASMYKCCRYRGYSAVSHLTDMLFSRDGNVISAMVYSPTDYEDESLRIAERVTYPYGNTVTFMVTVKSGEPTEKILRLRLPSFADGAKLTLDGTAYPLTVEGESAPVTEKAKLTPFVGGYADVVLPSEAGTYIYCLTLTVSPKTTPVILDSGDTAVDSSEKAVGWQYGCLVLAAETDDLDSLTVDSRLVPARIAADENGIAFRVGDVTLHDYASAGWNRDFTVWAKSKD